MERRTFVSVTPAAKKNKLGPIFSKNIRVIYKLSVKKQETGQKTGKNPSKKAFLSATMLQLLRNSANGAHHLQNSVNGAHHLRNEGKRCCNIYAKA